MILPFWRSPWVLGSNLKDARSAPKGSPSAGRQQRSHTRRRIAHRWCWVDRTRTRILRGIESQKAKDSRRSGRLFVCALAERRNLLLNSLLLSVFQLLRSVATKFNDIRDFSRSVDSRRLSASSDRNSWNSETRCSHYWRMLVSNSGKDHVTN